MTTPRPHLLFVCVKNGGKSQMAAALARQIAGEAVEVSSAGTAAGSKLNAESEASLVEVGASMAGSEPRQLTDDMLRQATHVVVVGTEAQVRLPDDAAADLRVWDIDEPSLRGIEGAERMRLVRDDIRDRVVALVAEVTGAPSEPARSMPELLFVCVHNAGRSQIAAAMAQHFSGGRVVVRSAGSAPADQVNGVALDVLREREIRAEGLVPKRLSNEAVQASDVVITMGCGDACPYYPGKRYEDWKVADPHGQGIEMVREVADDIERRIKDLLEDLGVPVVS